MIFARTPMMLKFRDHSKQQKIIYKMVKMISPFGMFFVNYLSCNLVISQTIKCFKNI